MERTREYKIEWLENATTEEVIEQMQRSAEHHGVMKDRHGLFTEREREAAEEVRLVKNELLKRLSK